MNKGYYYNIKNWELLVNPKEIEGCVKIPSLALLVVAPLLGGLFVVFLPLLGFYMVGSFLGRKLINTSKSLFGLIIENELLGVPASFIKGKKIKNEQKNTRSL